jgi:hypothetical protein
MALISDASEILSSTKVASDTVSVDEWVDGGEVRVRALTGRQRAIVEAAMADAQTNSSSASFEKMAAILTRCVIWCVINEDGDRLFTDDALETLLDKDAAPSMRIRNRVFELSGLSKEDVKEAEAVFDATQGDASSSD